MPLVTERPVPQGFSVGAGTYLEGMTEPRSDRVGEARIDAALSLLDGIVGGEARLFGMRMRAVFDARTSSITPRPGYELPVSSCTPMDNEPELSGAPLNVGGVPVAEPFRYSRSVVPS